MTIKKAHILYEFTERFEGGGSQFLKILKKEMINRKLYEDDPKQADCIIFNSHHNFKKVLKLKLKLKNTLFIHRIDGPIALHRFRGTKIDRMIYQFNNLIADGTIFQSEWSKRKNHEMGLKPNLFEIVIFNASDENIFYPSKEKKVKDKLNDIWQLVAVSLSMTMNKGFDLYKFLDENLDFTKYTMTFIGNSPIPFKSIRHIEPLKTNKLAENLREADIYITGAKKEACSNSIIEALMCGIPCIVINDASNPEILQNGGELFNSYQECLEKIKLVRLEYEKYNQLINPLRIQNIADQYLNFITGIINSENHTVKTLSKIRYYKYLLKFNLHRISIKISKLLRKIGLI